ncbi:glycosyl hydrolase [bacterium SCSIO 12741]|nr:glycosyl hydrolase [bacterium SCSIO 12741]
MRILIFLGLMLASQLSAQVTNVKIGQIKRSVEPSICLDPNNPDVLVAGAVLDELYTSRDGGKTWTMGHLQSSFGVWGDPVIVVDTAGSFYYFHLSNPPFGTWIDRIVCQRSDDQGKTWSNGTFTGLNEKRAQDKHWAVVDRNTNAIYLTWTQFDRYNSRAPQDSSVILFSKSNDRGETWSKPMRINQVAGNCLDSSETTEGAVPTMGPNGEVYVAWAGPAGLRFDRSLDGGETWLDQDILVDEYKAGWDYEVPGLSRCNGLPVTTSDLSGGKYQGRIYVNWSDQRNGLNNTDIWLKYSDDGGDTWSALKKVNDDQTERHQFLTWLAVDQVTGFVYCVFYDRRNYDDHQTDVYLAVSKDGGDTFQNLRISQEPFTPEDGVFFGDYNNLVAHNGRVRPIWARMDQKKTSVWTALYEEAAKPNSQSPKTAQVPDDQEPVYAAHTVKVKLKEAGEVSLYIKDKKGNRVSTVYQGLSLEAGVHELTFNPTMELAEGKYRLELVTAKGSKCSSLHLKR